MMMDQGTHELELIESAEAAVVALEAVELGEPGTGDSVAAAEVTVEKLRERAAAAIFPTTIEPAVADTIADYRFHTGNFPRASFWQQVAALHERCIDSHPALAKLLRGSTVIAEVADAASASAVVLAREPAEYAAEAVAGYQVAIAGQLHGRGESEPCSGILAETVPALQQRIATVGTLHAEHARVEKERQEHELAARRADLIERLEEIPPNLAQYTFVVPGRPGELIPGSLVRFLKLGHGDEHLEMLEHQVSAVEAFRSPADQRRGVSA